jgi:hypothetical protein
MRVVILVVFSLRSIATRRCTAPADLHHLEFPVTRSKRANRIGEDERQVVMTRSIFDPNGRETERSGSTFGAEAPDNRSRMPESVADGKVTPGEAAEAKAVEDADAQKLSPEERIGRIVDGDDADDRDQQPAD